MMNRIALLSRPSLMLARGRTDAFSIRFVRLGSCVAAVAILSASSCFTSPDNSNCGASGELFQTYNTAAEALNSPDLETSFSGGVRTFSWSRFVENVCSDEHVNAEWSFSAIVNKLPPGWRVDAGYFTTALLGRNLTLEAQPIGDLRKYVVATEIGLNQAFDDGPGSFLMFIDISFTSRGDLAEDRAVASGVFYHMYMTAKYKQHKTK
jgi:hypothetical protein